MNGLEFGSSQTPFVTARFGHESSIDQLRPHDSDTTFGHQKSLARVSALDPPNTPIVQRSQMEHARRSLGWLLRARSCHRRESRELPHPDYPRNRNRYSNAACGVSARVQPTGSLAAPIGKGVSDFACSEHGSSARRQRGSRDRVGRRDCRPRAGRTGRIALAGHGGDHPPCRHGVSPGLRLRPSPMPG